jgi:phosphoribosylformimino-5-aminoimidazole carboxamide ribotide isomerase
MKIFPAIDIEDGHCVRLKQGKIEDLTVYGDDPVKMALKWESEGAKQLHVVDLDGAFKGNGENKEIIGKMAKAISIPIEVGGGIRTEQAIKEYLDMGVYRVIIGSKAVASPYFAIKAAKDYGADHIAVSIDAKGDEVATHGWVDGSSRKVMTFAETLLDHGVSTIIYTDISRDGMLVGPNMDMMAKLQALKGIHLIASGGVSGAEDLRKLAEMGVYGAITGKALYEGKVSMKEIVEIGE